MRGIVAPIFGLLAVLSIVLGVLNATVWKPNSIVSAHANVYGSRYIVTDPGVLNLVDYRVKISVAALNTRKPICVAVGLAKDVRGWTRGYSVQRITGLQDWENLSTVPMKADDSAKSDLNNKNSVDSANNSDSKASKDVDFKDSDLWTNATCQMGLAKLFVNAEDFEQSENIIPGDLSSGNAVNQANQENQANDQSNHQKVSSALRARISRRVLIIDLGKNSPEAFVELRWRRHNLPDFATPLYFVGALFVLLCALSASVFAMAPHRRRNKRLVASRSGLITVENVSRDDEVKFSDAFAGTMAGIFGSFAKDKKSRRKGSSSHARHGAHSKTRVAKSQATVDLSVNVKSGLNSSPTPSLDETAVISKEDLQSYFARFASESVSNVSKNNSDSFTVLEVSDVSSDKSSSDSFKDDDDAIRDSKDSLNDDSNKMQSSKEHSGNSSNNNSRKSSHNNRGNRNSRYGRRNRDSHDNQDDRSSSRDVENRKYRDNRSKSAVAGDSSNEKSNNRSKSRDQGNHRDSNNHRDQRKNGQNGQNNQRGQKYGKNRRSSELDNRNRNSGENNANNRNASGNTNSNYNQNRRRKNNARGNEQK
ncbi:hypothetical protein CGSMWGv1400E_01104 [Gardnerella vaginalis 1400E]|uniref:Uncharacterized protein n=2 Tax=Gardnerella vaginalis TaxID=2702 RepID=I4LYW3_GARVA|nr:hypothetical protein CGSMWGv1400E_01104 [Gardnerella vaginalis 1400E]